MRIDVLEEKKDKLKIEIRGESQTLSQVIAKNVSDADAAAVQMHPFLSDPGIIVSGPNPRKKLENASQKVIDECDEFKESLSRVLKGK